MPIGTLGAAQTFAATSVLPNLPVPTPTQESGGFFDFLGDTLSGVVDAGGNFINGLLNLELADRITNTFGPDLVTRSQTAQTQQAQQASAEKAVMRSLIPGVSNVTLGIGAGLVVLLIIFFVLRR